VTDRSTNIPIGDGFAVRSLSLPDVDAIARYANNRKVWRNLRDLFPHPYHRDDAEKFITVIAAAEPESAFAIANEREAVGVIGFIIQSDVLRQSAEIGYWLGEPFWGKGIATRALVAVCRHVFSNSDIMRLTAPVFAWNRASARVLEKAGFIREGVMHDAVFKDGEITDQLIYGKLRKNSAELSMIP
jgi:ribosomal-protein-alanine N-acetyltransferase